MLFLSLKLGACIIFHWLSDCNMDNRFADKFYKNPSVPHVKATVLAKGSLSCKERCKTQRVLASIIYGYAMKRIVISNNQMHWTGKRYDPCRNGADAHLMNITCLQGVKRTKGHYNRLCFIIGRNVYSLYWSRSHLKFVSQGAQNIWCFFCTRQKTSLLFCPKLNFLNIRSHTCVLLWCKDVHNMKKYFWLFYMLRTIGKWGWRKSWTSIF